MGNWTRASVIDDQGTTKDTVSGDSSRRTRPGEPVPSFLPRAIRRRTRPVGSESRTRNCVRWACVVLAVASAVGCTMPLDPPEPVTSGFEVIAAGSYTTCALTDRHRTFCWGRGTSGQLGNGGVETFPEPVPVRTRVEFVALSVGSYHACALAKDGAAYCWGAVPRGDNYGQLGNGFRTDGTALCKLFSVKVA